MKPFCLSIIFIVGISFNLKGQKVYGFVDSLFVSSDLNYGSTDTLITFQGNVTNLAYRSSIDPFNGRYFFGGPIPGKQGNFHIINLVDTSILSYTFPEVIYNMEYDFYRNRIVFLSNNSDNLVGIDLNTMNMEIIDSINYSTTFMFNDLFTFSPFSDQFIYTGGNTPGIQSSYFYLINANKGDSVCRGSIPLNSDGNKRIPNDHSVNYYDGTIYGYRNDNYGIIDPCAGSFNYLKTIPQYHSHLNKQKSFLDHGHMEYIIPYRTTDNSDLYRYVFIDVINGTITKTITQPWYGKMNLQEIQDYSAPPLSLLRDTLFVPKGKFYRWYLDGQLLGSSPDNFWLPVSGGVYTAEVDFEGHTTYTDSLTYSSIGLNENSSIDAVTLYPNPTTDQLNIKSENYSKNLNYKILNYSGKLISEGELIEGLNTIDISSLPEGIYMVRIYDHTSTTAKKLIVLSN